MLIVDSQVHVWGADTLYNKGRGAQMGVAVVETLLARYSEFVINKYGLLEDLDEARKVVEAMLAAFLAMNSGAGRMFLMPSRVRSCSRSWHGDSVSPSSWARFAFRTSRFPPRVSGIEGPLTHSSG